MKKFLWIATAAVAVSAFCGGCQEKFTRQNYDTIYKGQLADEVKITLGEPYVKFDTQWNYVHEEPYYSAVIKFENGRVVDKSWSDEKRIGDHPDGNKGKPFRNAPENSETPRQQSVVE